MASKKSGLTPAQERELKATYFERNHITVLTMREDGSRINVYRRLIEKGLMTRNQGTRAMLYTLTDAGKQLAATLFDSTSTPETVASEAAPETVAGESVADSAAPVISEPVSSSAIPVTDALLPFAEGFETDSECAICHQAKDTVRTLYDHGDNPLMSACTDCMSEQWTYDDLYHAFDKPSFQWTHSANDMPRPVVTGWRSIHQAAWLFTERETVTGHGRKARKSANSRVSSKPMAKVTLANMQRRSKPITRKQRPVKPAIQIAEILRSMGIGKAA